MGSLTRYLQDAFAAECPRGWRCAAEVPLVDREAVRRLGFEPRADVRLSEAATGRRVWIEFEISRADPVANHTKFATAALLEGLRQDDCFVSMMSRHIVPGRAALAAGTTVWMRSLGIPSFQVPLLPGLDDKAIKDLNVQPLSVERDLGRIPVKPEIARVLDVSSAASLETGHRIHRADNPYTVSLNVRQWNADVATDDGKALWGRRRVQYFVADPVTQLFAPAKFCAFIPGPVLSTRSTGRGIHTASAHGMTMAVYTQLGGQDPRFDGHIARKHLEQRLGYQRVPVSEATDDLQVAFGKWAQVQSHAVICGQTAHLMLV